MRNARVLLAAAAVVFGALFLAACSGDAVSQGDVEQEISDQIAAQDGGSAPDVSCPDDLTAEVGETMDCEVTAESETFTVTVEVTSVEGDQANFDITRADG